MESTILNLNWLRSSLKNREDILQTALINIVERVPVAMVVCDNEGHFVIWNKAASELIPVPDSEDNIYDNYANFIVMDLEDRVIQKENLPIIKALKGIETNKLRMKLTNLKHEPKEVYLSVSAFPVKDINGDIIGGASVFHDIGEDVRNRKIMADIAKQIAVMEERLTLKISTNDAKLN